MGRRASSRETEALNRAQDLVYDAWEADTAKRRVALAKQALAISPLCADGYVLLAEHAKTGSPAELDLWRRGVEAGKAVLGDAFEEYASEFWSFHETRPYMRARFGLALALWRRGNRDEAIDNLRDMLRLNPNDNQGVRYVLAARLVEAARDDDLSALLKEYPDDGTAAWSWTAALGSFRRHGDSEESRALLSVAIADNRHVVRYLLGDRRIPQDVPPYYSSGDEDEAIGYAQDCVAGWVITPGATDWLRGQVSAGRPIKRRQARRPQ